MPSKQYNQLKIGKLPLSLFLNIKKQQNAIFNFFYLLSFIYDIIDVLPLADKPLYRCVTRNWSSHSKWMEQSIYS